MHKYKLYVLFLFIISIININIVFSKVLPLYGKTIVIDPGHGGKDTGAFYYNTYESDINYNLSLQLKKQLINNGARVYLTRNGSYDLSSPNSFRRKKSDFDNRLLFINSINPDCVISVHMNASSSLDWSGLQLFYSKDDKLAKSIYKKLKPKRDLKRINKIYFMDHINYPCVLIEYGFISNYNDLLKVKDINYQIEINNKIIDGIISYFQDGKQLTFDIAYGIVL